MNKILNLSFGLLLLVGLFLPRFVSSGGGVETIDLSSNKSTAIANGSDSVLVTVRFFRYQCTNPKLAEYGGGVATVVTYSIAEAQAMCQTYTGSSNVLGKITVEGAMAVTNPGLQLLIDGSLRNPDNSNYIDGGFAYFTIKSTTPGTKTVVAKSHGQTATSWSGHDTLTITFTAPTTSTPTTTKPVATATATQTQQQTQAQGTPPAVPALEKLQIGENEVTGEKIREENQFRLTERKVFSGKTIPNGIVKFFFQSDPFEDTVTADANGNWTYELKKDLGEGEHSLQIAVTDPNTNLTSEKSAPTKFVLVAGEKTGVSETVKENNYLWYYLGAGLLLLAGVGAGFFFYSKKKQRTKDTKISA